MPEGISIEPQDGIPPPPFIGGDVYETKWSPDSGVPPPLTPEYGVPQRASTEWDPNSGLPPPMTPEYGVPEATWPGKELGFPPPLPQAAFDVPPPLPQTERQPQTQGVSYEAASAMQERAIKNPEMLSGREYSKRFLVEERQKLAEAIRAERRKSRDQLAELGTRTELEGVFPQEGEGNIESLSSARAKEANLLAERLSGDREMTAEDVGEERENIAKLIDNDEKLTSLKARIAEHYARADKSAKEKFAGIQKSVEQALLRNKAFIVHTFLTNEELRHNENSNVVKRATFEDDIDLLLSLEPSISTSSVVPGTHQGLWEDNIGVILGGGDIAGAEKTDADSISLGIKKRKIIGQNGVSADVIDEVISKRDASATWYNEIVVDNPKVFGIFKSVKVDPSGRMHGGVKDFENYVALAKQKGMPAHVMTPDRRIFEFISIDSNGDITVGAEITPDQVATGRAGLPSEKRKEIGEEILSKHLFRNIQTQAEAKGILSSLEGKESSEVELSREEYLAQLKDNPELVRSQLLRFPENLRGDKNFMLESASIDAVSAYELASEELKGDADFVRQAYALRKAQGTVGRSIYSSVPETLRKDEDIALLAIENNDLESLDASFVNSPVVWERIVDKKVEQMDPDKWFTREIGKSEVARPSLFMRTDKGGNVESIDLSERLATDENFTRKLNERYPHYKFGMNEYKEFLVTKLA